MSSTDVEAEHTKGVKFEKEEGEGLEEDEEIEERNETGNENDEEGEEEEEEEEEVKVKKKRCQRRKKISQVCYDDDEYEDGVEISLVDQEEEEEEEGEEEDESDLSYGSSILSAITFEWENEVYEFDELCDPGNIETIYRRYYTEPDLVDEIGILRYLHACNLLRVTPMVRLLRAFETDEIDLSYRNIDGKNIRAMCYALEANVFVKRLILRFNRIGLEDSFYMGRMLSCNEKISHLDFTGCKISPQGAQILAEHLSENEALTYLNLSKCNLQDEGVLALSQCLTRNNSIQYLDLSYNNLGDGAAEGLGVALKMNSSVISLNLRYNNLFDVQALKAFFRGLTLNSSISSLNLAWNGMNGKEIGNYIGNFLKKSSSVIYLDLSDNRFEGQAVGEIKKGLMRSRSLVTLKIGNNPMTPENLDSLLSGVKNCSTLQVLDLENLWVKKSFVKALKKIRLEREIEVNFGGVFGNYEILGPDYPKLILQRAQFEAMKPKNAKSKKDFGHLIWTLGDEPMSEEEFKIRVKKFKAKINKELYPELIKEFFDPKLKLIDVVAMKKKYLSIFPNSEPPPPPKEKDQKKKGKNEKEEKKAEESVGATGQEPVAEIKILPGSEEERAVFTENEEDGENEGENEEEGTVQGEAQIPEPEPN